MEFGRLKRIWGRGQPMEGKKEPRRWESTLLSNCLTQEKQEPESSHNTLLAYGPRSTQIYEWEPCFISDLETSGVQQEYRVSVGAPVPSVGSIRKEFLYRRGCNKEDRVCWWEGEAEAREGHCSPVTVGNGKAWPSVCVCVFVFKSVFKRMREYTQVHNMRMLVYESANEKADFSKDAEDFCSLVWMQKNQWNCFISCLSSVARGKYESVSSTVKNRQILKTGVGFFKLPHYTASAGKGAQCVMLCGLLLFDWRGFWYEFTTKQEQLGGI